MEANLGGQGNPVVCPKCDSERVPDTTTQGAWVCINPTCEVNVTAKPSKEI